jgi:hypothetical protein
MNNLSQLRTEYLYFFTKLYMCRAQSSFGNQCQCLQTQETLNTTNVTTMLVIKFAGI